MDMDLKMTEKFMNSEDHKERFIGEYLQTKIRYEKLKRFNNKIDAASMSNYNVSEPKHDSPNYLLKEQQRVMGEYLHILEIRAVIEGIEL